MPNVTEDRSKHQQDPWAASHLSVNRHQNGCREHEEDKGAPPSDCVRNESESEVPKVRADLYRHESTRVSPQCPYRRPRPQWVGREKPVARKRRPSKRTGQ